MLTNFDIIKICHNINLPLVCVVCKDELYGLPKQNGFYIVNMQNSTEGNGSHWIAFIKRDDTSFYFDSYGFVPPIAIIDFLKPSKIAYSDNDVQYLTSQECGWYCISFLKYMQNSKNILVDYNKFINLFSEDEKKNDKILFDVLSVENSKN